MKDNELDEMLDHWQAPPMRESLREDVRTGFAAAPKRVVRRRALAGIMDAVWRIRIGRIAVAGIAAAVLLFGIVQFFPKTARMASSDFRIPFYVEFEFARYDDHNSTPHITQIKSFPYAGHEIVMSVTESTHSFWGRFRYMANAIRDQIILLDPSFVLPKGPPMAEPAWFAGFVKSGCSIGKNVVGHETIAGHAATIVEDEFPTGRFTFWLAPDLDCFAVKLTNEVAEPNGTYRTIIRKEALSVTMNP